MNIWSSWLQGRDAAPNFVRANFDLWTRLNPDHVFHVIEYKEALEILDTLKVSQNNLSPQVITNIVRVFVLSKYGGVWADSTLLPTTPISKWLTSDLTSAGFFAFRSTGDPNLILQNWFLYAEKNNPLMTAWLEIYTDYFQTIRRFPTVKRAIGNGLIFDYIRYRFAKKRRDTLWFVDPRRGRDCIFYPYAAHNYNLAYLLKSSEEMRSIWDSVPRRMASLPSFIGALSSDEETSEENFISAVSEVLWLSPVHKLNHHTPILFEKIVNMVADKFDTSMGE